MKTTIFNKKALTFFGAASVLLAAVFLNSCKTSTSGSSEAEMSLLPKFAVTFSVDGANGTLKAKAESVTEMATSPISVQQGKTVTFTAIPETGYKVDKWTVTGGTFGAETGRDGSTTAKVKISVDTKVDVSFISEIYDIVPFGINGAGLDNHLKTAASHTDGIYYIKVTELTAADLKGDYINSPPAPSALGKILNDNPTKKVALKLSEVSGLTDISACFYGCKSLTQVPVIPSSVTNMQGCFINCKSLTQAPVIPNGVTNMSYCFDHCEILTQAPVIPSSVTDMRWCFSGCTKITAVTLKCDYNSKKDIFVEEPSFADAFKYCEKLTANSIKVPAGQLSTYKANAATMGTTEDKFVAE